MNKKAVVILADGFEDIEGVTAIDILRRSGVKVTVAGVDSVEIKGSRGITIKADNTLDKLNEDFDVCILPGGMPGAENLASNEKVRELIINMNKKNKIIAAICASPAILLAPLGILDNKSATCYPGMENEFNKSTVYKKDDVVVDGNIVTSKGVGTAMAFSLKIVELLLGKDIKDTVSKAILV